MTQKPSVKAGIVGATGYTGVELLRLLAAHPGVEVCTVTSRQEAGKKVADLFGNLRGVYDLTFRAPDEVNLSALRAEMMRIKSSSRSQWQTTSSRE